MTMKNKDVFSKYTVHGGMASPVPNWYFDVTFGWSEIVKAKYGINDGSTLNDTFKCIKADLPKYEQGTKTINFFGTEKTFVLNRKSSGETTLEFWVREPEMANSGENGNQVNLFDILAPKTDRTSVSNWTHLEFSNVFEYIEVQMMNVDKSNFRKIKLINPVLMSFDAGGELNYEGDSGLKMTITVHYDTWENLG